MKTVTCREIDTEVLMELASSQSPYLVTFHGKPAAVLMPLPTDENLTQLRIALATLAWSSPEYKWIGNAPDLLTIKSHQVQEPNDNT